MPAIRPADGHRHDLQAEQQEAGRARRAGWRAPWHRRSGSCAAASGRRRPGRNARDSSSEPASARCMKPKSTKGRDQPEVERIHGGLPVASRGWRRPLPVSGMVTRVVVIVRLAMIAWPWRDACCTVRARGRRPRARGTRCVSSAQASWKRARAEQVFRRQRLARRPQATGRRASNSALRKCRRTSSRSCTTTIDRCGLRPASA